MAAGLPVEGEEGPFLGDQVVDIATCEVDATVGDARARLDGSASLVVVAGDRLVVGEVDADALAGRPDDTPVLDVLRPVPSTVRPSVTVESVAEAGGGRRLVTTADGRLLGQVVVDPVPDEHDHRDHGGDGHGDAGELERELASVIEAVQERFGERPPTEEELQTFLRDRLVAEGRSEAEADRFVDELGAGGDERAT